ncbi:MAG: hypothetical protein K9H49_14170 [Bacteroidales bacterium]|nr:hypothetical protein [Bacteroidales bacterium]MCF8390840.1 hypothetical protein [Bacteroidales bacterium]
MSVNKILIATLLLFLSTSLFSQINTYSPYSRFGIGELALQGNGQYIAQGASGIAQRSNLAINYLNPASYSALDTMSFIFDFGLSLSSTDYNTNEYSARMNNMNMHHLGIAFPITKWWKASIGVSPYSSVGYEIIDQQGDPNIGLIDYYFTGTGGLNRFYWGSSFTAFEKLSLGINYSYFFGYINNTQQVSFPVETDFAVTKVENTMTTKDGGWNFGLQYHETFNDKYFLTLGAIYDNKTSLTTKRSSSITNYFPGSSASIGDTILLSPTFELERLDNNGDIIYPGRYGFGLSTGIVKKLSISAEYESQQWSESLILGESDSLKNSKAYRFGMEYTPDQNALRGYFKKVHYRIGGYYSDSYLRIYDEALKDYGITFGVGLPLKGFKSTINLGMVLGQRGTLENNLIKENYRMLQLSFTLYDFWFYKRKFD